MGKGEARGLYVPSGRPCVPDNVALRQNPFRPKVRVGADEPAPIIGLLKQLPLGNGIMLTDFSRLPARWTWVAVMTYDDVMFTLGSLCDPGHFVSHELDQINRVACGASIFRNFLIISVESDKRGCLLRVLLACTELVEPLPRRTPPCRTSRIQNESGAAKPSRCWGPLD